MDRTIYPNKRRLGYLVLYERRKEMPVYETELDEDTTLFDLLKRFRIVDDYSSYSSMCETGLIKVFDFVRSRWCKIPDLDDYDFLYSRSTKKNHNDTHLRLLLQIAKKECQFHFYKEKLR